ncbi:MAG: FxLYD domain-containing protein [Chloroflexota bacterium]|nr:FxLYD domain-containing protein [Chloroflexota bacterium]
MKKKLIAAGFLVAGIIGFAGTCTITHISLTKIGTHDTFAGEIHNDSGVNILSHHILVAFLDSNLSVVETKNADPQCERTLQNGAVDYFSSTSSQSYTDTNVGLARINFDSTFKVGTADSIDVTYSNVKAVRNGTSLVVTGTIKNNDSTKLESPNVCVVVYASNDNVIIVKDDESLSDLSHNSTDTFSVSITVPDSTSTVDHVDLHADGLHGDVPTVPEDKTGVSITNCGDSTSTPTRTATGTATATATAVPPTATGTPPAATNTPVPTSTPVCS